MEFRKLDDGSYFPPVLPNGDFMAIPYGGTRKQLLFRLQDEGIFAAGVFFLWEDLSGIMLEGSLCRIVSDKYLSGGVSFQLGLCEHRLVDGEIITAMRGYEVDYCLMNRITFERQRLVVEHGAE